MKHHVHNIILFLVTLSFLFTGCSASTIGLKMADQIKEHTSSSTDSLPPQDVTPSEPAEMIIHSFQSHSPLPTPVMERLVFP